MHDEARERLLRYWSARLADPPAMLELPTDHFRPAVQSCRRSGYEFTLPADLTTKLRTLSTQANSTLFVTLLAAFQVLLFRYSGQTDILVGTPMAARSSGEPDEGQGISVNTLVVRVDLSGSPSFHTLLTQVRQRRSIDLDHQELPFDAVVEALDQPRSSGYHPLIQVLFALRGGSDPASGAESMGLRGGTETRLLDLTLELAESAEGLRGRFEYAVDLFEEETIARMAGHYAVLLTAVVADPDQPIDRLPLLTGAERRRLMVEWNDTAAAYPVERCIHQQFEEQAARTPDAVAVVFGESRLTYDELNVRANRPAYALRERGVGPGTLVALCLERSPEMVVGLLAILKAGGAYVPLDPTYPIERLAFMLADSQAPILLTQKRLLPRLPNFAGQVLYLDSGWEQAVPTLTENPVPLAGAEHPAYVIYTSGSTGVPKGVVIPHRAIANHMAWMGEAFPLSTTDRVLQKTPFSFDASVWEFYAPLLVGARLVLAAPGGHQDSAYLISLIQAARITILQVVPTMLRLLAEEPGFSACTSLRRIFCGGEALTPELQTLVHTRLDAELINLYGPTEATIDATSWVCERGENRAVVPIGRPVANTQVYILDPAKQLLPIGVPGELYIGGGGLALGYLRRPDLTAERFVPNPLPDAPGLHLYRTGDKAYRQTDGTLVYVGRLDFQVKLRGFRIELSEIEAVLRRESTVAEVSVVVREDRPGDQRLVAYVVPTTTPPDLNALRAVLHAVLPDYMVPAGFVLLEALPLTPNGKVDRKALPAPDPTAQPVHSPTAPRTPTEEQLAVLWAEVLGLPRVGVHDNFFELGGHSLSAGQVLTRARSAFAIDIPLTCLFEHATLADLAHQVDLAIGAGATLTPTLTPVPRTTSLPLSAGQHQIWLHSRIMTNPLVYNECVTIHLPGYLDVGAFERSFSEFIRRHEAWRTTFAIVDGHPIQVVHSAVPYTIPLVDLRHLPRENRRAEALRLASFEARTPFDLTRGPLVRAHLMRLDDEDHSLFMCLHHSISDGVTIFQVFLPEMAAIYEAFSRGAPSPLPEPAVQYVDYAARQGEWLEQGLVEEQLSYWRKQLAGSPPILNLPTDHPRPLVPTFRGAMRPFAISRSLTEALKTLAQRQGITFFTVLLAAFYTLLYRYTGQTDLAVGTIAAGRKRPGTERMVGFFINEIVLYIDLADEPSFPRLLERVSEALVTGLAHADVPFEQIVKELRPQRDPGRNPLFQVLITLEPSIPVLPSGWTPSQLDIEMGTAKLDLGLELDDRPDGLIGRFEYSTDLFDARTIERMVGHWQTLLESIVIQPTQKPAYLPLLTAAERRQLLVEWNNTTAPYPSDRCIHQLFEEQAARTPDAPAAVFEDKQLSYAELNAKANQLAHRLIQLGVGPERLVGLCVERSLDMIVGVLGILKAGGAYVPLDPSYPQNRLAFMLEDAEITAMVTQAGLHATLPPTEAPIVLLDEAVADPARQSTANPAVSVNPSNLVYIIYTSGSTGKPKAVPVNHRSLVNTIWATRNGIGLRPTGTVVAVISLSFDPAGLEIYVPLVMGARVVIAGADVVNDGVRLAELLRSSSADLMVSTPAGCRMLLASGWSGQQGLIIFCGSEAMTLELARSLIERGIILWNGYGPTEITIFATWRRITLEDERISIGRPIANTQTYILDRANQPVPIGLEGELCIGGIGVARGYLHQPELTAERFVPDPFSSDPSACLYRTGDLARWLPDGTIECLGRMDQQVKVRGFRVELGEIETVLRGLPMVNEAAVIALQTLPGLTQLIAYIVPVGGQAITTSLVRNLLREQLPDYMVPTGFVILDALPKTPNGKLDRGALPAFDPSRMIEADTFTAPRTPTEKLVAGIWGEALGGARVGIHDNFFELGGHSLMVAHVIARIHAAFGIELPMRLLFERPTVAQLAEALPDPGNEAPAHDGQVGAIPRAGTTGADGATTSRIVPIARQARRVIRE